MDIFKEQRMKIAVYFSGRITAYEHAIEHMLKMKNENNITFFCSLNLEKISDYEQKLLDLLEVTEQQYCIQPTQSLPNWVKECLPSSDKVCIPENVYSHFFHNQQCWNLIQTFQEKNNILFNVVCKYRADICCSKPFSFSFSSIEERIVYIPEGNDHTGLNDQIAYGNMEVMKMYSTLFERLESICSTRQCIFHPETLVEFNMKSNNISVHRFDFAYTLDNRRRT
jgi:hypothetical protein